MLANVRKFLRIAIPVCVFVFAVLAGWGLDAWREFLSNPARAGVLVLVAAAAVVAILTHLDFDALRPGKSDVGRQSFGLLLLALASVGLLWLLPYTDRRNIFVFSNGEGWRWFGLFLCTAGVTVRLLALQSLGKQFSAYVTLQEEHQLVQSGVYGVVRHPLYLSLLLAGPGFGLVFRSLLVWPILALTLTFVTSRIYQEEKLLAGEFGAAFERYRKRTWLLVPFVF